MVTQLLVDPPQFVDNLRMGVAGVVLQFPDRLFHIKGAVIIVRAVIGKDKT